VHTVEHRCRPLVNAYEVKADVVNVHYGGNVLSATDSVGQLSVNFRAHYKIVWLYFTLRQCACVHLPVRHYWSQANVAWSLSCWTMLLSIIMYMIKLTF